MEVTSQSLLIRLQGSNEDKDWNQFDGLYRPLIRSWLFQHGESADADIDDLTQVVMLAVTQSLKSFEHNQRIGAFRAWLKSIVINRLQDFWRSRHRRATLGKIVDWDFLVQWADPNSELSSIWDREYERHILRRATETIESSFEPKTFQAFRLQMVEGLSAAETAETLGLTRTAVLIAKSRVLKRLREEAAGLIEN